MAAKMTTSLALDLKESARSGFLNLRSIRFRLVATTIGTVVAYLLVPMRSLGQDSWKIAAALMSRHFPVSHLPSLFREQKLVLFDMDQDYQKLKSSLRKFQDNFDAAITCYHKEKVTYLYLATGIRMLVSQNIEAFSSVGRMMCLWLLNLGS